MKTVLMIITVIKRNDQILLRKTDPKRNPYKEPWALFGGRVVGSNSLVNEVNYEFRKRWNMSIRIIDRLWWDEDQKIDHDGEEKRFIYLDVTAELVSSSKPTSTNINEQLSWVATADLSEYELNPPTRRLLSKLRYLA